MSTQRNYLHWENPGMLRNLSRLTKLHLDAVNISSAGLLQQLSNFTDLTSLSLRYCQLVGEFPPTIFQLPKLETLDAAGNPLLNGSLPGFPRESALQTLVLSYTGFSGSLPHSFGYLRNLTTLDLSICEFSGPITSLGHLTQLQYIDLTMNHFSGQLPSLLNLTRLAILLLDDNELHGDVPLHLLPLPSLLHLFLSNNQLDGELHEFANASSTLWKMKISHNKLRGQIPGSISKLSSLQILDLSSNQLNGSFNLDVLGGIKYLDLSDNNLLVNAPVNSSSFPNLAMLYLASCNLKQFPGFLRNHLTITDLDLSNNNIVGEIPSWLWNVGGESFNYLNLSGNSLTTLEQPHNLSFSSLAKLDLHSNQLQGEIPLPPSSIVVLDYSNNSFKSNISFNFSSSLGSAIFFSISNSKVSGEIPPSICYARRLEVLDLSGNRLSGSIPNCLGNFSALGVLNLGNNCLTGITTNISIERCLLRTLNLNGNQLEGKLPEFLSSCGDLEVLDVGNNRLSGPFPNYQNNTLSKLRVLVLRSNNFSGSLLQVCNASSPLLQIIDLSSNNFSGSLPPNCFSGLNALIFGEGDEDAGLQQQVIGFRGSFDMYYQDTVMVTSKGLELKLIKILTIFKSVDLSNNKLEGEVPKEMGALKLLRVLNMSHNYLMGQIPASIGNVRMLESFDLSQNQLSGRIPPELSSLTFLEVLNLSYNQLVGSIPTGPQFLTFTNDSFIGNPGLCGPPLSRNCVDNPSVFEEEDEDSVSTVNWLLISVQLGYVVGLAIFFGPLLLWRKWRMWYFKQVDMMLSYLHYWCYSF